MSIIADLLARFAKGQQSITELIPLYMRAAYSTLFRIRIKQWWERWEFPRPTMIR